MKSLSTVFSCALLVLSLSFLVACSDGNMEQAGQIAGDTLTDVKNKTEDLCEKVKEGVEVEDTDC